MSFTQIGYVVVLCMSLWLGAAYAAEHRLPQHLSLQQQIVHLELDPNKVTLIGSTTLEFKLEKPSQILAYHSKNLNIKEVQLIYQGKHWSLPVTSPNRYEIIEHELPLVVESSAQLHIVYSARYSQHVEGVFQVKGNQGNNYLLSQFQSMEARRVFPTLDEPDKKTQFTFHITTPKTYSVLHNTNLRSVELRDNMKVSEFSTTPLMNTDILTLAVGKFKTQAFPDTRLNTKVYSPAGNQVSLPDYFSSTIEGALSFLEQYLAKPFPFKRLDFVIGNFGSVAAMENLGLISLNENQIPQPNASIHAHCQFRKLLAHEVAHSWFGNDITMAWYDDYWLNESFTEFIAAKVTESLYPNDAACTHIPQAKAFYDDNSHALPLIFDVKNREDTLAYGQLHYTKGRAILEMLEQAAGESAFQKHIQQYVLSFAGGNVSTTQFSELFKARDLQRFIASFTQSTGFPLISVSKNKQHLVFEQQDWLNRENQFWTVPLTIKLWDGRSLSQRKLTLEGDQETLSITPQTKAVFIDAGGVGYFRYVDNTGLEEFPFSKLNASEQASFRDNQQALAITGYINYMDYIQGIVKELNQLDIDTSEANELIGKLLDAFLEHAQLGSQEKLADYLNRHIKHKLDWSDILAQPFGGDTLKLFGLYLKRPTAIAAALHHYRKPHSQSHAYFSDMVSVLANSATKSEYKQLIKQFKQMPSSVKNDMLSALGYVSSEENVALYYDLLLSDATQGMVIDYRFQYPIFNPALRLASAKQIKKRESEIFKRVAQSALQWFPYNFLLACSSAQKHAVEQLFLDWQHIEGIKGKLDIVKDNIDQCTQRSQKISKSISAAN
ncbi:M1 family aminopeptidase [Pseudoalteromonas luteoviolacea]|uniref:M1 family aminopeptidase n=1 Tax=Pseudoalteromonas luteoviolacea TaxID=43657 RepID=UPI001B389390|nr:M1 family aminopeptidase [Pseudoalteromonas luteoviolacea]MBQ4837213.1 hypothetical protein [Pseudoalteromonas luteoviolacea]